MTAPYDYWAALSGDNAIEPKLKQKLNNLVTGINLNNIEWAGNYSDKIAKLMISEILIDSINEENPKSEDDYMWAQIWTDFQNGDHSLISNLGKDKDLLQTLYDSAQGNLEDLERFDGTLPPHPINYCMVDTCRNYDLLYEVIERLKEQIQDLGNQLEGLRVDYEDQLQGLRE
jgi:hypothetical protein